MKNGAFQDKYTQAQFDVCAHTCTFYALEDDAWSYHFIKVRCGNKAHGVGTKIISSATSLAINDVLWIHVHANIACRSRCHSHIARKVNHLLLKFVLECGYFQFVSRQWCIQYQRIIWKIWCIMIWFLRLRLIPLLWLLLFRIVLYTKL